MSSTVPQQRRVWQYVEIGELPDILKEATIPLPPTALNGGIVIKVAACGLNPVDLKLTSPKSIIRRMSKKPGIPALEYSGVVVAGNLKGTGLDMGTAVYGTDCDFLGVGRSTFHAFISPDSSFET